MSSEENKRRDLELVGEPAELNQEFESENEHDFFSALAIGIYGAKAYRNLAKALYVVYCYSQRSSRYIYLTPREFENLLGINKSVIVDSRIIQACADAFCKNITIKDNDYRKVRVYGPNKKTNQTIILLKIGDYEYEFLRSEPSPDILLEYPKLKTTNIDFSKKQSDPEH